VNGTESFTVRRDHALQRIQLGYALPGFGERCLEERLERRRLRVQPVRLLGAAEPFIFGSSLCALPDLTTNDLHDILCRQLPSSSFSRSNS
jgi:hypothetical protein